MGVLETAAKIIQLGGDPRRASRVAAMRASFERRTGAFSPDDAWFEPRSRAFWSDAITRGRFGRQVQEDLTDPQRRWLGALESAHRGLFRAEDDVLVDVWSGAELLPTLVDDESRAELDAAAGQLFDARVLGIDEPFGVVLLPGAVFHPRGATAAIGPVLTAARAANLSTHDTLDALLRMERTLRSLARVKAAYAYRADALTVRAPALPVRGPGKTPR